MGSRAQVKMPMDNSAVYFYTHWGAPEMMQEVKSALAEKVRWNDEEYLARMIFCRMVGDDMEGETGYGIGLSQHGDIEYLLEVNCEKRYVEYSCKYDGKKFKWSFEDYIELSDEQLKKIYNGGELTEDE